MNPHPHGTKQQKTMWQVCGSMWQYVAENVLVRHDNPFQVVSFHIQSSQGATWTNQFFISWTLRQQDWIAQNMKSLTSLSSVSILMGCPRCSTV